MNNADDRLAQNKLNYLVGYMEAALTNMRDLILEEHYSKLFPKIEDALKLLKERYNFNDLQETNVIAKIGNDTGNT